MAIIKCKMCGGDIQLAGDKTFGTCEYCGSTMTFPKSTDEQRTAAFNRGNAFRRAGEFDKALTVYERIVAVDDTDAEAHWCCALCRFGIEWVEDPNTFEYVPTCHRASFDSFLEDVDYLAALENSDGVTRRQYQRDGTRINEVQRGILATSQSEKPFDVFICYKELDDETGERTRDSIDAQEIYYNLVQEGYRVFFSRITLEDKVGTEYEPYIFAALNSAKVMVVLGSKPEYFNAVWVRNEWSRYLTLMHKDRSRLLLPCYKNMNPYDLPDALSVLMSYDMTKIGFMQDLLRGIRKVLRKDDPKPTAKEPVIIQQSAGPNVDSLLQRAFIFLEDQDWQSADEYCERVLDQAPKTALAYLGKLMVELRVSDRAALAGLDEPFDSRSNFQRAIRFGDDTLRDELEGYNAAIRARVEENRLTGLYNELQTAAQRARTEDEWLTLAKRFGELAPFRDAERQAENCRRKAEAARKAADYDRAIGAMNAEDYAAAAEIFDALPGFRDAEQKAAQCREMHAELLRKAEEDRLNGIVSEAAKAINGKDIAAIERAITDLESIADRRDVSPQIEKCKTRVEELKRKGEAEEQRRKAFENEKTRFKKAQAAGDVVVAAPKRSKAPIIALVLVALLIGGFFAVTRLMGKEKSPSVLGSLETASSGVTIKQVAAGGFHTVGLLENGRVVAVGLNNDGQCDVDGWRDIVAIHAGTFNTIGIKADGTVVAVGKNIGVSTWKDIVSIATSVDCTFGLDKDGTIVKTTSPMSIDWENITAISAGGHHIVGLKEDGTVVAGGGGLSGENDVSSWTDIIAIAAGDSHTVGLRSDGTVVAAGFENDGRCDISGWTDIVAISAGKSHTLGLKSDGHVIAVGSDVYGQCQVSDWSNITAVDAGCNHSVGLQRDGTVVFAGPNFYGECDVDALMEKARLAASDGLNEKFRSAEVGDEISFGRFEQDNDLKNGPEAIEWIVLAKEDNRLFLLSKHSLACMRRGGRTWTGAPLRVWLNEDFLSGAFTAGEQTMIPAVTVKAEENQKTHVNPGTDTHDQVFLLSISEVETYLNKDQMFGNPTEYALSAVDNMDHGWWLRSPGYEPERPAYVTSFGELYDAEQYGYDNQMKLGVRPALWVDLG